MLEQRIKQRFELHLPYEIHRVPGRPSISGRVKNVSSAGVLFSCGTELSKGEKIEYSLTLPRAEWGGAEVRIRCTGTVVRTDAEEAEFVATVDAYEFVREVAASAAA